MNKPLASALLCFALFISNASAFTRDDLIRDYDAECSFMEKGLFTTTDLYWHSVEHKDYVVSIVQGEGDDGLVIKNFLPGESDLKATFNSGNGRLTIPVQEWPFTGFEFCQGTDEMQFSGDSPVMIRPGSDASGNSEIIIDFPKGSWGVRDAQYGDYISVIMAQTRLVGREKPQEGIEDAVQDAEDGEGRYYNLQGHEVANPEHGIFIYIAGGKAAKVIF